MSTLLKICLLSWVGPVACVGRSEETDAALRGALRPTSENPRLVTFGFSTCPGDWQGAHLSTESAFSYFQDGGDKPENAVMRDIAYAVHGDNGDSTFSISFNLGGEEPFGVSVRRDSHDLESFASQHHKGSVQTVCLSYRRVRPSDASSHGEETESGSIDFDDFGGAISDNNSSDNHVSSDTFDDNSVLRFEWCSKHLWVKVSPYWDPVTTVRDLTYSSKFAEAIKGNANTGKTTWTMELTGFSFERCKKEIDFQLSMVDHKQMMIAVGRSVGGVEEQDKISVLVTAFRQDHEMPEDKVEGTTTMFKTSQGGTRFVFKSTDGKTTLSWKNI